MLQDVRLALRALRRQPSFAALVILIIALGAVASGSVFAVVHAVLLRPLPFAQPGRLVAIAPTSFFSGADAQFLRDRARTLADVASSSPGWRMSLLGVGDPVQIVAARPTVNLLAMLGVRPVLGRLFDGDDGAAGRRAVILSHRLWQGRFGADPFVIGRTVMLDGAMREIVGVVGPDASVLDEAADAWVPFDAGSSFARGRSSLIYARLRPEADHDAATREAQVLLAQLARDTDLRIDPAHAARAVPLAEVILGDVRSPLLFVTVAVGILIVLTSANVGTLLLGRSVARRRDVAVRAALGASRLRLARETLIENLLLATVGSLLGLVMARLTQSTLVGLLPGEMPRLGDVAISPAVIATVVIATVGAVLLLGVTPVLMTSRTTAQPLLRQGAHTDGSGGRRALDTLVVAQVALAIVLGLAAALMGRSLWRLQHVDPGFSAESVLTLRVHPAGERYRGPGRMLAYYRAVSERVAAQTGVEKIGLINHLPLSGYNWVMGFAPGDRPASDRAPDRIGWRMVDGDYFDAMRIPLRAGRTFRNTDDQAAPRVVVINETAARRYFGSAERAMGRVVQLTGPTGAQQAEVVGVVGDVRHLSVARQPEPEVYQPVAQTFTMAMTLVVRTAGKPAAAAAAVRTAVWSVDADVAIAGMAPLTTAVRENLGRPRMIATLLLIFAVVGVAVVLCGVYGVVAYTVRRREREIGIRIALGAAHSTVRALVFAQGARYALAGLAIGLPSALIVGRLMRGLLFGIEPHDAATVVALCAAIAVAIVAATIGPARRATRIQPGAMIRGD